MSRNNNVRVDGIDVGATQKNLIGAGGLALLVKYLSRTGFFRRVNSVLPSPGSNAGYAPEVYIKSLFALRLLYPDGPAPLSRIDEMGKSRAVRKALGVKRLPCSEAVGDWLRRMGGCERVGTLEDKTPVLGGYENGLERMLELFYWSAGTILRRMGASMDGVLDFDASCIYGEKRCDEWMYTDATGSMSYLGFMGPVCLMAELERGNHSPSDNIGLRIESCIELASRHGKDVSVVRTDSAGYTSSVINACENACRKFYVRADMDSAVRRACAAIKEEEWLDYEVETSKGVAARVLAATVHCMEGTEKAFSLVVKREILRAKDGAHPALTGLDTQAYKYWCIATNEVVKVEGSDEGLTPAQIEEAFNDHCVVENRVKQMKTDAGAGRLPTSEMSANRVYVYIMAMLSNLFELFKVECLPAVYGNKRLPTLVRELFLIPSKIVVRGHRMLIDLPVYLKHLVPIYEQALRAIRENVRALAMPESGLSFSRMIFRRD